LFSDRVAKIELFESAVYGTTEDQCSVLGVTFTTFVEIIPSRSWATDDFFSSGAIDNK
jgi:hypothetical protein